MTYAQVVVNTPLIVRQPLDEPSSAEVLHERAFTYSIPAHLADKIALGQLVWVPFGARRIQGVVAAFTDTSPVELEKLKAIDEIVDPRPFLSPVHLDLARWIAATYLCSFDNAIRLMIPPGVTQQIEILLSLAPDIPHDNLTAKQTALVDWLAREGKTKLSALPRELHPVVKPLVERNIIVRESMVTPARAKPKRVNFVRLISDAPLAALPTRLQDKARKIVDVLHVEDKPVWVSLVYAAVQNCTLGDLRKLEAAGIVALEEDELWRDSLAGRAFEIAAPPKLTSEQEAAWQVVRDACSVSRSTNHVSRNTFLLHGVTGSGKTEIYMRALAEMIAQGKQGIVLVPEISLTPQTIRRFGARFKRLAIAHSDLWIGERYDTWRRCRDGLIDVVIGTRSALFAPLPNLGLIVIDEEHDTSYKQADLPLPGYHAREVALELARKTGATVILGSATPDVETYYRATRGEIKLLELPKRVMGHRAIIESQRSAVSGQRSEIAVRELGVEYTDARYLDLPPVELVDLRAELKAGNRSMFSRALQREMARVLAAREQVILFLNRRGTATFILCRDCGYVFKCKRCNNPMTLHGVGNELVCHHCNRRDKIPVKCPQCGGARIRYFGVGTEKVEAEIQTLFPKARTLRWDWDVTRGKDSHEAILEKFVQHQADVLIGTQMIAKGLDLPFVTLVGVVSADTALNLPDFRAGERTFQLLTQVAGRAGRSILGGKVIVQTYAPENYAIQAAAQHDYRAFYDREIIFRREQNYPPYSRLIRLLYQNASAKQAQAESMRMYELLSTRIAQRGLPAIDLIGPAPAFLQRLRGEYRYQIVVRGQEPHALVQDLALPLGWRIDVDPVSVL